MIQAPLGSESYILPWKWGSFLLQLCVWWGDGAMGQPKRNTTHGFILRLTQAGVPTYLVPVGLVLQAETPSWLLKWHKATSRWMAEHPWYTHKRKRKNVCNYIAGDALMHSFSFNVRRFTLNCPKHGKLTPYHIQPELLSFGDSHLNYHIGDRPRHKAAWLNLCQGSRFPAG